MPRYESISRYSIRYDISIYRAIATRHSLQILLLTHYLLKFFSISHMLTNKTCKYNQCVRTDDQFQFHKLQWQSTCNFIFSNNCILVTRPTSATVLCLNFTCCIRRQWYRRRTVQPFWYWKWQQTVLRYIYNSTQNQLQCNAKNSLTAWTALLQRSGYGTVKTAP